MDEFLVESIFLLGGLWMMDDYIYIIISLSTISRISSFFGLYFYLCLWFWGVMVDLGRERFSPICWILDDTG